MKFDPGTLIYLILTLIFVALGAAGKRKKPVNVTPPENAGDEDSGTETENTDHSGDILAENFRRLLGDYGQNYSPQPTVADDEVEMEIASNKVEERAEVVNTIEDRMNTLEDEPDLFPAEAEGLRITDSIKMSELGTEQEGSAHEHDDGPLPGEF